MCRNVYFFIWGKFDILNAARFKYSLYTFDEAILYFKKERLILSLKINFYLCFPQNSQVNAVHERLSVK